jgi:hypothetical protein
MLKDESGVDVILSSLDLTSLKYGTHPFQTLRIARPLSPPRNILERLRGLFVKGILTTVALVLLVGTPGTP